MKGLFIEAKYTGNIKPVIGKSLKLLPKKVGLVTTIQHKHQLKQIKEIVEKAKKKAVIGGQILGCDVSAAKKIKNKVDAFLYIGSGEFHPLGVALETNKKVIVANPLSNEVSELKKQDVENYKKKQKGALIKFLSSKTVGILVSLKPGQQKLEQALGLRKNLKNKKAYIFIADTLDLNQLENFPFIECWINTACPRLVDKTRGIVNYETIRRYI
ncbi:2-(3-amino-3-carboxypropyl)histidine synthase subunit [Candidatus Woesearchaeota archaeon]|nr:2-(3-amino-3-carboxypropyl)histidine synthase subunit [Candidatus Woesearchaeota archaeon]